MANEISSIASLRGLSGAATNSRQVATTDVASLPDNGGQALPINGKEQPPQAANTAEVRQAVSEINEIVQSVQRDLSFNMDEGSGKYVIRVVDTESGELIRQIPTEEVLAIASQLREFQEDAVSQSEIGQGLLFSDST
ncbi:MAG: flagellar protein FlaG [Gammaproteobacteria bacterium]|nr:flagellar protein FlaG [Gammaproteobacteria bacterium]MDH3858172.1 flagellar protein FlaG [Gammaproteobacteria bacterium]